MKQPIKQITLRTAQPMENDWVSKYYHELPVVRSVEEGELLAYIENVGHAPNNLPPDHPGYKFWTWKSKRDGNVLELTL